MFDLIGYYSKLNGTPPPENATHAVIFGQWFTNVLWCKEKPMTKDGQLMLVLCDGRHASVTLSTPITVVELPKDK
jgi:hypothetical protein